MNDLVTALIDAMDNARRQLGQDTFHPTSTAVALVAEDLIAAGWPARLDGPVAQLAAHRCQDEPDGAP